MASERARAFSPLYGAHPLRGAEPGPTSVVREADGTMVESYVQDGVLHREDGPAEICRSPGGKRVEVYYDHGRMHRSDGPAEIIDPVGIRRERVERYFLYGEPGREDGLLEVKIRPGGGRVERYAGPNEAAHKLVVFRPDGTRIEKHFQHGNLHRLDGPAQIIDRTDGSREETYWRHGGPDPAMAPAPASAHT